MEADKAHTRNPLQALQGYGQSVWLDYIRRSLITCGELQRLITEDGLVGVTSNPAIFEKAIVGSTDYKDFLASLESDVQDSQSTYERLAIRDIQDAAALFRPVYERTKRRDGYVSLEVSPYLARDTKGTVHEARRLWKAVGRENLMIKVPGTPEGIPAIEQLIGEGINVNVTLLFALDAYERAALAYIAGLEHFTSKGGDPSRVASVASFFVSRIDTAIDAIITSRLEASADPRERALLRSLAGNVAIANAKLAYQFYRELFTGTRWQALARQGAQTQRLLWASTSTKNPKYRDVLYVEELIGPDTVNTIPPATFDAFRDHGHPRPSLVEDLESAQDVMESLAKAGISMKEITARLLAEGVQQFATAFDALLQATGKASAKINRQSATLPAHLTAKVDATIADWKTNDKARLLWRGDPALWTGADESKWVGWLGIVD